MSHHRQLPVWKAAMDLAVYLERAVPRFKRRALVALWQPRQAAQPELF